MRFLISRFEVYQPLNNSVQSWKEGPSVSQGGLRFPIYCRVSNRNRLTLKYLLYSEKLPIAQVHHRFGISIFEICSVLVKV